MEQRTGIVIGVVLGGAVVFLGCAGLIGLGFFFRAWDEVDEEVVATPSDPEVVGPSDPTLPPHMQTPEEARADMRRRYRPGPYVEVEGMLPSGRLEVQRVGTGPRHGRTLDTPWVVGGAELRNGAAPSADGDGAPSIRHGDDGAPITVVAGVPAQLPVRTDPGSGADGEVRGLLIAFHDYPGHFFLPATVDTELGHVQVAGVDSAAVHFGLDAAVRPDGSTITGRDPYDVVMYVAAVDVAGRVSPYMQRTARVMPVGNGDVEVTLTMGETTDLDLYVVDPAQNTIYYGNSGGFTGAELDLDANAACSGQMGVDAEHIFWPANQAPAGTYTVRVAHYESCIGDRPVDYRVTVRNCGETVVLAGRFEGPARSDSCLSDPGTEQSWCQNVVEFEVRPCDPAATVAAGAVP